MNQARKLKPGTWENLGMQLTFARTYNVKHITNPDRNLTNISTVGIWNYEERYLYMYKQGINNTIIHRISVQLRIFSIFLHYRGTCTTEHGVKPQDPRANTLSGH
jgi:hypothetical protein